MSAAMDTPLARTPARKRASEMDTQRRVAAKAVAASEPVTTRASRRDTQRHAAAAPVPR